MPYIQKHRRKEATIQPVSAGELNFAVTQLVINYIETHSLSYTTINDVVGVLDLAKAEFIRRVVVPYEEKKKETNGDVYPGG
jgi:hypothetical protein